MEIAATGDIPSASFVHLIGVPAKRCKLRGYLRVLDSDCTRVSVMAEGPEEDVREYYDYMRLSDNLVGTVTKVEEKSIEDYTETEAFHVVNFGDAEEDDRASDEEEQGSRQSSEDCQERREPGGCEGEQEVRVVPETPEKAESSSSESDDEVETNSFPMQESETMLFEPPKSPVFKASRPPAPLKRRKEVGYRRDESESEEESQSILCRRKRQSK